MSANIGNYLSRFRELLSGDEMFKSAVCAVIFEITGFEAENKNISISSGKISIKTDPYLKTEILFKKEEIIKSLKEKFPSKNIVDIV